MPKTLAEAINTAIDSKLIQLHTSLPCEVVAVNIATQSVNVKVVVNQITNDDKPLEFPIITEVPIGYTKTNEYNISFPINIGDTGLITFSERQLDYWIVEDKIQMPDDFRKHSMSDGLFTPNFYNRANLISDLTTDALEIRSADNATKFSLNKNGDVTTDCKHFVVNASESFTVNSPNSNFNGGTVKNDGTSMDNTHTHSQGSDSAGNTQQNTTPPN